MSLKSTTIVQDERRNQTRTGSAPGGQPSSPANAPGNRALVETISDYFRAITESFGAAWNRFWFTPTDPLVLYTILTYTPDLELLLSPDGLLAQESVTQLRSNFYSLSYFYLLETPGQLWAAHLAGLAVLALFTVGLFTRVTSILSLIVVLSYFHRSFVVTSEVEPILAFVMFYLCLAPAGAYLSLDRWLARRKESSEKSADDNLPRATWTATVPTRLIQVHLTLVYVMMLLAQLNETPWWDGTAVWWLLGRRESAMSDLTWLYVHPWLVNAWTHSFVLFEGLFIVLAWNRLAAPLLVAASVLAWGLMSVATGLAPLAAIMIVAGLSFLTPDSLRTLLGCCRLSGLLK
jgi:hypothetical protein